MWPIHKMEYYSEIRSEVLIDTATWMNLENITISERSPTETATPLMISFLWNVQNRQTHRQKVDWWFPKTGGRGADGFTVSFSFQYWWKCSRIRQWWTLYKYRKSHWIVCFKRVNFMVCEFISKEKTFLTSNMEVQKLEDIKHILCYRGLPYLAGRLGAQLNNPNKKMF